MRCVVLIVDDGKTNREILKRLLTTLLHLDSADVDTAEDGLDCLEKLTQRVYNIIFMDLEMPKLNGIQASYLITRPATNAVLDLSSFSSPSFSSQSLSNAFSGAAPAFLDANGSSPPLSARSSTFFEDLSPSPPLDTAGSMQAAAASPTLIPGRSSKQQRMPPSRSSSQSTDPDALPSSPSAPYSLSPVLTPGQRSVSAQHLALAFDTAKRILPENRPRPSVGTGDAENSGSSSDNCVDLGEGGGGGGPKIVALTSASSYRYIPGLPLMHPHCAYHGEDRVVKMRCVCESGSSGSSSGSGSEGEVVYDCANCCTMERYCRLAGMHAVVSKPASKNWSLLAGLMKEYFGEENS